MKQTPFQIISVNVNRLDFPAENPNSMTEEKTNQLARNIQQEGFLQPVLVVVVKKKEAVRFEIVDGCHRVEAAKTLGIQNIPAIALPEDYPKEKRALLQIGMNRLRGDLDLSKVSETLVRLSADDSLDLALSGFTDTEIEGFLLSSVEMDPNDLITGGAPLPPETDDEGTEKVFSVTLEGFESGAQVRKVKAALKKASGSKKDMAHGLLRLLGLA